MLRPKLRHTSALLGASLIALTACTSTPTYKRPDANVPPAFKEAAAFDKAFAPANPGASRVPDAWWELFNDPGLNRLEERVTADNASVLASAAAMAVAQAALGSSRAALWPTLGLSAGANRSSAGTTNPVGTSYNTQLALSSWEIDIWDRLGASVDAAKARAQASHDDLAAVRLSVQASVAQSYFSLVAADSQAAILDANLTVLQRSLQLTQNRYQGGVASASDVSQAQAQLSGARAQRLEVQLQRAQLEHALAALVGLAPAALSLQPAAALPLAPTVPAQLPSQLLERRPDIAAAERRVAAANAAIGAADAAFFPALTLSTSYGYRGKLLPQLLDAPNRIWSIGPSLVFAAFDGGARKAASASANASYDQAVASYRGVVLTALQEVEDNLVAATILQEEEGVQQQSLEAARKTLQVTTNQYAAGTVSYLNVVTAQSAELSAQTNLLNVQNRRLTALAILLKNIAGRWDAVLK